MLSRFGIPHLGQEVHQTQATKAATRRRPSTAATQVARHPLGLRTILRLGIVIVVGAAFVALVMWVRLSIAFPHMDFI